MGTIRFIKNGTIDDGRCISLKEAYIVPRDLMRVILDSNSELLQQPYNSLTEYGKGVVDTLNKINTSFSIHIEREYDKIKQP
jgi:hypothetical protein